MESKHLKLVVLAIITFAAPFMTGCFDIHLF